MQKQPSLHKKTRKKFESILSLKAYAIDTAAGITFYVPIIGMWEFFVVGLSPGQFIASRTTAILANLVLARAQGKAREFFGKITNTDENSSFLRKLFADTLTSICMTLVPYALILTVAGATPAQMAVGVPFVFGLGISTGRIFGEYLDWARKKFGTTPLYEKKQG